MSNYDTIYLDISKEEAARMISKKVSGIRRRRAEKSYRYEIGGGLHLATLSDATVESGEQGSKLRYRTSVVRPHLIRAWSKAKAIRAAVDDHRTVPAKR